MADDSVSLHQIGAEAGVSAMTVSRVLRQSPKVSETTRQRVMAAAERLGYQPDPHLARMMHLVRGRKESKVRAVLAVVREVTPDNELHKPAHQYVPQKDIVNRAAQHGYAVEEFWLGRDGLTPSRLTGILQARGIEGIIISPQSSRMLCAKLDFSQFASVTFGYGLREPSLHRSAGNMTLGVHMVMSELVRRGYKRPGLAITQWVDNRSEHAYSGAMLHFQQDVPKRARVPLLLFPHNDVSRCRAAFIEWMQTHRPDVVISFDTYVPDWLKKMGLKVPEDVGLVVHDWTPRMKGLAGMYHRRDHVAAAAVDLLATQLLHHEKGVPEVPRQILIPPQWMEGESIRSVS